MARLPCTYPGATPDLTNPANLVPGAHAGAVVAAIYARGSDVNLIAGDPPLVTTKAEFLREVLVVTLDPPAQLGGVCQGTAADVRGQRGQKVFGRLGLCFGPLDR